MSIALGSAGCDRPMNFYKDIAIANEFYRYCTLVLCFTEDKNKLKLTLEKPDSEMPSRESTQSVVTPSHARQRAAADSTSQQQLESVLNLSRKVKTGGDTTDRSTVAHQPNQEARRGRRDREKHRSDALAGWRQLLTHSFNFLCIIALNEPKKLKQISLDKIGLLLYKFSSVVNFYIICIPVYL